MRASRCWPNCVQAGYRIAALTNWSAETFPVARERFPFLGWFEDIVISGVEGIAKPDPAMFALALQRTGFVADRTVFIDDNLPNIEGARAVGHAHGRIRVGRVADALCPEHRPALESRV